MPLQKNLGWFIGVWGRNTYLTCLVHWTYVLVSFHCLSGSLGSCLQYRLHHLHHWHENIRPTPLVFACYLGLLCLIGYDLSGCMIILDHLWYWKWELEILKSGGISFHCGWEILAFCLKALQTFLWLSKSQTACIQDFLLSLLLIGYNFPCISFIVLYKL